MLLAYVTVIHPPAVRYRNGAAVAPGGAVLKKEREKRRLYETADPNGYAFVPLVSEPFGRLGRGAMEMLHRLGDAAAGAGVHKRTFMRNAMRELSVAVVKGNGYMFRAGRKVLARACGSDFQRGQLRPTAGND